jgi:uncharacterized Zn finger protein
MSYWGYKPYVPVAKRREQALKAIDKAKKKGANYSPIEPYKGAIAKTFWGKAWCSNLEQYSDYDNRLPRGRTYVRNGSVIDLKISAGQVQAKVMGSSLYDVCLTIKALSQTRWKAVCTDCSSSVASLIELLQGKLSHAVMARICMPTTGLFPAPTELEFECSCPDWASMCKHVAAVLYGVGARLDQQPDLLFTLRHVDAKDLVQEASLAKPVATKTTKSKKVIEDSELADVFGLDMVDSNVSTPKTVKEKRSTTKKTDSSNPIKTPRVNVIKKVAASNEKHSAKAKT